MPARWLDRGLRGQTSSRMNDRQERDMQNRGDMRNLARVVLTTWVVVASACIPETPPESSSSSGGIPVTESSSRGIARSSSMGVIHLSSTGPSSSGVSAANSSTSATLESSSASGTVGTSSATSDASGPDPASSGMVDSSGQDPLSSSSDGASSGVITDSSSGTLLSSSSSGAGVDLLSADPATIDFGVLPVNGTAMRDIRVRNISGVEQRLGTVVVDASAPGGLTITPGLDGALLAADQEVLFTATWTQLGADQIATIRIPVENANGYQLSIFLYGAQDHAPPNCTCTPATLNPFPLETPTLRAQCTDPYQEIVGYRWDVEQRPNGSTSVPTAPNATTTQFFVDLAGDYLLRLSALQARGDPVASCTVAMHSVPPQHLHIQLVWDTDRSDVDLHLLGPQGGNYFSTMDPRSDCYYSHKRAAWGDPTQDDDATLDIDDVNGRGPENINIIAPKNGTYTLGVHYYCNHSITTPTTATVRIFCNGVLRRELQRAFTTAKQFWDVATIDWDSCAITENTAPNRLYPYGDCAP